MDVLSFYLESSIFEECKCGPSRSMRSWSNVSMTLHFHLEGFNRVEIQCYFYPLEYRLLLFYRPGIFREMLNDESEVIL
jgi:hypothetical protein